MLIEHLTVSRHIINADSPVEREIFIQACVDMNGGRIDIGAEAGLKRRIVVRTSQHAAALEQLAHAMRVRLEEEEQAALQREPGLIGRAAEAFGATLNGATPAAEAAP